MKRRWYKWFALCAGLVLCVEACMLMVEAPDGSVPLRYRIADWWDRLFGPRPVFVTTVPVFTVELLVADEEAAAARAAIVEPLDPVAGKPEQPAKPSTDWPMFGGTPQRNMVSLTARNIPADWCVEDGKLKNVKWMADLGTKSYGGPVVADGKVFFGTNNGTPRDKAVKGQKAVLMCFNEADGKFLWQAVHEIPNDAIFNQMRSFGLVSTPCVEGKRHYYVTPGCEVICADNATGKTIWSYDLMAKQKVVPFHCCNCSPLIVDNLVMIVTGNGSDDEGTIASPKAPSFIALDKSTGQPAWQSNLPGTHIIEGQWSNPAVAVVGSKKQVIFPGGDCWLYSFDARSGQLIWKCDCNPQRRPQSGQGFQSVHGRHAGRPCGPLLHRPGRLPRRSPHAAALQLPPVSRRWRQGRCLAEEPRRQGPGQQGLGTGVVVRRPDQSAAQEGPRAHFGRTISTCAVHDGLVYVSEEGGYMNCLDANTGQRYWQEDLKDQIWGSPLYVDGKVFLGTEGAEIVVYQAGKTLKTLGKFEMGEAIHSTPVVANDVLYVSTWSRLFAIAATK